MTRVSSRALTPVAVHTVAFAGATAGTYELTWAQRGLLRYGESLGAGSALLNVRHDEPVTGFSTADLLRAIAAAMHRYEALRTRFAPAEATGWCQQVAAEGELRVPEFACTAPAVETTLAEVIDLVVPPAFGAGELPVRFALVTVDGRPARILCAAYHPAVDGVAASIACADVARRTSAPEVAAPPVTNAWQPRQIAAYEQSPAGQQRARRAEAYLRDQLRRAPLQRREDRPPMRDTARWPTFTWAHLESEAVTAAAHRLARSYGTSPAAVVFAGYLTALTGWLGTTAHTFRLACANRHHRHTRWSVANLFQPVLISVEPGRRPLPEVCRYVARASLAAYQHGWFDPARFESAHREMQRQRGGRILIPDSVNLRAAGQHSFDAEWAERERIPPGEPRDLADRSIIKENTVPATYPSHDRTFSVWTLVGAARITVMGDSTVMPPDRPAQILRDLVTTLLDACDGAVRH
ncbi:MAG: hypothetical protein V7603_1447 [Micromonosporaceae bacterium]